ncbi:glycoside hydrolase family 65 protein [Pseudonocardia asaccharolytica]|uniref:Trehalose 6-phosphate phosphorylase n=1 Tax=Pseudonocardia asaccharolytica DSM 44247 = NBRC 16224 TaxID=1123024 RepID=A0A511CXF3_9PSEU|nr:glycosyl hydrolase family 65 protein [Pseudonocardia asaccharolytica]GEL17222.1 trehalose 6-phosphate phosphorylase [Pseudonocardia asaccharolytica DSM 44247 = NBRC 16224]
MTDAWTLVFDGWDPADEGRREALCTLGNGRFATRGAAPESAADGVHYPGTYAAGCYNRLRDEIAGRCVENESLVNLPNWLDLRFAVGDGEWIELSGVGVLEHRLELDLRRGLLSRTTRFVDGAGRRTSVHQRRFVHMARPHLAGLHTVITAEDWSGRLCVASGIDGSVTNSGVRRYQGMSSRHLEIVSTEQPDPGTLLLVARTTQSRLRFAAAARTRVWRDEVPEEPPRRLRSEADRIAHELDLELRAGEAVAIEKVVALVTSRDVAVSEPAAAAVDLLADAPGFDELLESHALAWHQLWRRFRFELTDGRGPGTVETLRTLRLNVFHLLASVSSHNVDLDAGIPARGLHGEAYRGHVFWDELFVFPVLTLRLPELPRALLRYRTRRLDAARWAARLAGHTGAMYPWQSGSDGREETQQVHLNPRSGRWLPDTSHLQRHVGLAVAYSIWQYYQSTGDMEFLATHGAETILEIARFWAGLASYDPAIDRYRIWGVMGPDEYSTRYPGAAEPGIDDNAYTNVMVVWLMLRAEEVLAALPPTRRIELEEGLGLSRAERLRWQELSRRMYVPIAPDGIISQFEGYRELPELDWDDYRRRYGDIQRLDRILEAEGRSVDDYQVSKQADVLMLFYLMSADELRELLGRLGYELPPEAIPRTIDYYLARTCHGSTLSALVHAWVLARAHREQAMEHFDRVLNSDIADIQGGTTAEGVHLGAMAGSVDLLQRCFAGVETRQDALWFNPHWPDRYGRLTFAMEYRGQPLTVEVCGRRVQVSAGPGTGRPIRVGCGDEVRELRPGQTVGFVAEGTYAASARVDAD